MAKWLFGGLFCGVAGIFIVAGIVMAIQQDRTIRNAEPVKATIVSSNVKQTSYTHKGRQRTRYSPDVKYEYVVSGKSYTSETVYPTSSFSSNSASAAREIVGKFPAGARVDAFYDKRDHASSFLVRRHSFAPYFFILFPMIHMAIGVAVVGFLSRRNKDPIMRAGGRWELPAGMAIGEKFKRAALLSGGWYGIGALAAGHYFSVTENPETIAIAATVIYCAIGLVPLAFAAYYFLLKSKVSDAVVTTDAHPLRRGQPVNVRVKIDMLSGGRIETATLALTCREDYVSTSGKKQVTTRDVWRDEHPIARPQDLTSDRAINAEVKLTPPLEHPPSTMKDYRGYPKHRWELSLNIKRTGPDYRATFPVEVL